MIGRYAVSLMSGGRVRVRDRCDATIITAARGSVTVENLVSHDTTQLRGGDTYSAEAPAPAASPLPALRGTPGVINAARPVKIPGYPGPVRDCVRPDRACRIVTAQTLVRIGHHLDLRKGAVSLETGPTSRMTVYGGIVRLEQAKQPGAILTTRLAGGDFARACRGARRAPGLHRRSPRYYPTPVRKSKYIGKGPIQAAGKNGNAIAPGTAFRMVDRCDGTYVEVTSGTVTVLDVRRHRTKTVRAGHDVLIPRPGG